MLLNKEEVRVLPKYRVFDSESVITTNDFTLMRRFDVMDLRSYSIVVKNTHGSNSIRVMVYGSVDGTNLDKVLVNNSLLSSGNTLVISGTDVFMCVDVYSRSNSSGNHGICTTRGLGASV